MREHVTFGGEESPCTGWLYEPDANAGQQPGQEQRDPSGAQSWMLYGAAGYTGDLIAQHARQARPPARRSQAGTRRPSQPWPSASTCRTGR